MSSAYHKIVCNGEPYYYPCSNFTQEEALDAARLEFQCEPVYEGLEFS